MNSTLLHWLTPLGSTRSAEGCCDTPPGTLARIWAVIGVAVVCATLLVAGIILASNLLAPWAVVAVGGVAALVEVLVIVGTCLALSRLVDLVREAQNEAAEDARLERLERTGKGGATTEFQEQWLPSGWEYRIGEASKRFSPRFADYKAIGVKVTHQGWVEIEVPSALVPNSLELGAILEIAAVAELMVQWRGKD